MEKWAVKIKSRMLLNNIRQNDLADKLGITKTYLSMLLKGRRVSDNYNYTTMSKAIDEIIEENKRK